MACVSRSSWPTLRRSSPETYEGIVNCSTYYMALDNPQNKKFREAMSAKYGGDSSVLTVVSPACQ